MYRVLAALKIFGIRLFRSFEVNVESYELLAASFEFLSPPCAGFFVGGVQTGSPGGMRQYLASWSPEGLARSRSCDRSGFAGRWRGPTCSRQVVDKSAGSTFARAQRARRAAARDGGCNLRGPRTKACALRRLNKKGVPLGTPFLFNLAESEGFEPPVGFRLRLISSQVHSTGLCQLSLTTGRILTNLCWVSTKKLLSC